MDKDLKTSAGDYADLLHNPDRDLAWGREKVVLRFLTL